MLNTFFSHAPMHFSKLSILIFILDHEVCHTYEKGHFWSRLFSRDRRTRPP
jgi:hypothetical protein